MSKLYLFQGQCSKDQYHIERKENMTSFRSIAIDLMESYPRITRGKPVVFWELSKFSDLVVGRTFSIYNPMSTRVLQLLELLTFVFI